MKNALLEDLQNDPLLQRVEEGLVSAGKIIKKAYHIEVAWRIVFLGVPKEEEINEEIENIVEFYNAFSEAYGPRLHSFGFELEVGRLSAELTVIVKTVSDFFIPATQLVPPRHDLTTQGGSTDNGSPRRHTRTTNPVTNPGTPISGPQLVKIDVSLVQS